MTAKEFIEKFPEQTEVEDEDSHLHDMACPSCGERGNIKIQGTIWAWIHCMGTDRDDSDFEFDGDSSCQCCDCLHCATVDKFTIKGLDGALREKHGEEVEQ